jgi:hydroxymethylglutaryl-CoA reductase
MPDSRLPGLHRLNREERLHRLVETGWLDSHDVELFGGEAPLAGLENLSENVLGRVELPIGVATNVVVNNLPRLIPMAIEEPSVVAACSNAARLALAGGGVTASAGERLIAAQVLVNTALDEEQVADYLAGIEDSFVAAANANHPRLVAAGGGLRTIKYSTLPDECRKLGVFQLLCHPGDAMGANAVNDFAEEFAQVLGQGFAGTVQGAIVSNHAPGAPATATTSIPFSALTVEDLHGRFVAHRIETLSHWARADGMRRATHVKGILNGLTAVANALYQDTRALASTLWSHLCEEGGEPAVVWSLEGENLVGRFEAPVVCGTVGGTGPVMPLTALFYKWMGVTTAKDLEAVLAAVGLLQNLAALRAIATEGIQRGHMRLHARKNEDANG